MTNLVVKVLDNGREKFRHTAAETVDFTMVTVSGTAANPNEVLKQEQLGAAVTAVPEVSTVGFASATPAGLSGKYFRINSPTVGYYVWFDLDDGSTDPSAANTGRTGIEVNIATGDTDAQIAGKAQAVLEAHSAFTATVDTTNVTITNSVAGAATDIAAGDSGLTVGTSTQGVDARVGGIATLNGSGKLTASQVPAIAITDTFVVASQVAMLALSTAETGDVAVRTDLSKSFILAGDDPATLGDWQELLTPADAVASVNGQTGTVVLYTDDISEDGSPVNLWFTQSRVRSTVLTGLSAASGGNLAATDTVLEAFGKLEYRVALNDAKVTYSASTARSDLIETASITDGENNKAPCSNLVFDALALKANAADVSVNYKTYKNTNASAITVRQFVYVKSTTGTPSEVDLARANAAGTCTSKIGIVRDASIDAAANGTITIAHGAIISGFSGLTPGAAVYLSPTTAGAYTQTCPSTVGQFILFLGEALSETEIEFCPGQAYEIAS